MNSPKLIPWLAAMAMMIAGFIGPTLSPILPQSLTPGTAAAEAANNGWQQDGIRAEAGVNGIWDKGFSLWFRITNEGSGDFIARFKIEDFKVSDDTGKTYPTADRPGPKAQQIKTSDKARYVLNFQGSLSPDAKKLILRLDQLSTYHNITIEIPI